MNASAAANDSGADPGPSVLTLPPASSNRTGFDAPDANLSAALSMRAAELDGRLRTLRTRERLAAFDSAGAKRKYVRSRMTVVENAADDLRDRQRDALAAHAAGDVDGERLLVRLARIDAAAGELRTRAAALEDAAARTPRVSVESDARVAALKLRALEGPVRDRVGSILGGAGTPATNRIYVRTTPTGVVLSTVAGGTYLREAYAGSLRTADDGDRMPISKLTDVVRESYPEAMATGTLRRASERHLPRER